MYDVIIVGGSFAGLAVASQLNGFRVLLIDKNPIGSHQTSACGTPMHVIKHWGLEDAVLQMHDSIFFIRRVAILNFLPLTNGAHLIMSFYVQSYLILPKRNSYVLL